MAKRLSLAEKYAISKQNDPEPAKLSPIKPFSSILSPIRQNGHSRFSPSPKPGRLTSEIPELKPYKSRPTLNGDSLNHRWEPRSPIRSFRKTALLSPNRIKQTSQLYNIMPHQLSPRRYLERNRVSKDRSWLDRKQNSYGSKPKEGVFLRFKSFLNKFSLEEQEHKGPDFEALKESVLNVVPSDTIFRPEVELGNLTGRKRALSSADFDEVDTIVQKTKARLQENQRNSEKKELVQSIEREKLERENLEKTYERQIYIMEQKHMAKIHELTGEIEDLTYKANIRLRDLDRQKLRELENSVMKDNETFLLQHRENEERLQLMKTQIEQKEEELKLREKNVEKMEIQYLRNKSQERQNERDLLIFSEGAYDTSSPKIERKESTVEEILPTEEEEIERAADMYEFQVINFYDTMQRISEQIIRKQTGLTTQEQTLLESLENIVKSLDEHINVRPHDLDGYEAKLEEYSRFFEEFNSVYAQNPTNARKKYRGSVLSAIKTSFDRLTESLNSRLLRKAKHLRDLESNFARVKITDQDYSQYRINRAVRILKGKADIIFQQKRNIALLNHLRKLTQRISEIQGVVQPEE